jgi:translation initiation factor IF-1
MSKEETIKFTGRVVECLPNATFKVKLENNITVLSTISGRIRKFNINILMNDLVDIEMTPYDLSRGRIIFRHKE